MEYLLLSRHKKGHGIHSPFVFDLVYRVFRNKIDTDIVFTIEKIRKKMISDPRLISVIDLGSGSERMKTSLRKVSDIARYSAVPLKYGCLLSNMSKEFGKTSVIECGTSLGISTMYIAASCPDTTVHTIEGCPATSEIAKENFKEAGLKNIKLYNGPFDEVLPVIRKETMTPGLIFFDGNHRKEPVVRYFDMVAEISDSKTVIIIDDIYSSKGMTEAWYEIKKNKKVTFTIDIFRMGFLFFRQGVNRFDYIIRY